MKTAGLLALIGVIAAFVPSGAWEQESSATASSTNAQNSGVALVAGRPFSAIKYARQIRVLPDGKQQFLRNERYPAWIARDAGGRVMMQMIRTDDLQPECDHLDLPVPPICPAWSVFVIDPAAHTIAHWPEGEMASHVAVDFPLSEVQLERAARATAELPELPPDFSDEDGEVTTVDLGDKAIEGVQAHGIRTTLEYTKTESGRTIHLTRIHEVWTAPEMKLIIRVIDGNPRGVETVSGLENISIAPNPTLFRPPADYVWQHRSDEWERRHPDQLSPDFEYLDTWFSK